MKVSVIIQSHKAEEEICLNNTFGMLSGNLLVAMGCGDPETPKGGWIDRDGNKAIFGCNGKETTWTLTCDGTQWTGSKKSCEGGNFFNCSCTVNKLSFFPEDVLQMRM